MLHPDHPYSLCNTHTVFLWVISGLFSNHTYRSCFNFTGFLKIYSKSAVADEKYFNHISKTPCICCISLIYRLFLYISISSCQWHIVSTLIITSIRTYFSMFSGILSRFCIIAVYVCPPSKIP